MSTPISDVVVELWESGVLISTTSTVDGIASFLDIPTQKNYKVKVIKPSGYSLDQGNVLNVITDHLNEDGTISVGTSPNANIIDQSSIDIDARGVDVYKDKTSKVYVMLAPAMDVYVNLVPIDDTNLDVQIYTNSIVPEEVTVTLDVELTILNETLVTTYQTATCIIPIGSMTSNTSRLTFTFISGGKVSTSFANVSVATIAPGSVNVLGIDTPIDLYNL